MALTSRDLNVLKGAINDSISTAVPKALRIEFVKLGLATEGDDDQLNAQADFRYLRTKRLQSETDSGTWRNRIIAMLVSILTVVGMAGVGALLHAQPPPPTVP